MRHLLHLLTLCCALTPVAALAQAGSNWQRVEQLPPHTHIHLSADHKSRSCSINKVDDETLICSGHTYARTEVRSVKVTRYLVSTLAGAGIGAGGGAIVGVALGNSQKGCSDSFNFCSPTGEFVAVGALAGAIPGAIIGYFTDFAHGATIYRRP